MSSVNPSHRRKLYDYLRNELIGPGPFARDDSEGNNILDGINPIDRFPCGVIYPAYNEDAVDQFEDIDDEIQEIGQCDTDDNQKEDTVIIRRHTPPSSFGLSFYIKKDTDKKDIAFFLNCHAVTYKDIREQQTITAKFERAVLKDASIKIYEPQKSNTNQSESIDIWGGIARVHIIWRPHKNGGYIVTISLINNQKMDPQYKTAQEFSKDRAEKSLFEAYIEISIESGLLMDYPEIKKSFIDEDQQEIQLQYSEHKIYAIGHGTSVDWQKTKDGVKYLKTDSMPATEVPMLVPNNNGGQILDTEYLYSANKKQVINGLTKFVDDYQSWRKQLDVQIAKYSSITDKKTAYRITDKIDSVIARMRSGISLLDSDEFSFRAFRIMNMAIHKQNRGNKFAWRPFQLGFLLTTIESVANEHSDFRDTVDLIWFPTGGGKTEAYLGLVAFLTTLRRLQYPESAVGTMVIMRYTLRLLTRDQFLRAAKLIFALELIRRDSKDLGETPFSIGIWVGGATSPNTCQEAKHAIDEAIDKDNQPALVIDRCPYCGEEFSIQKGNYVCSDHDFHFYCKNPHCPFGKTLVPLPCYVVDEVLYKNPPTFLVATVDKFARLAWEPKASAFFGKNSNIRPPELVIQDELHLISSALGSIVGVYESGIDTILRYKGIYPKYIASTATIRSASSQVKSLFGREVAVYPAQGLSADDSYFAKTIPVAERPGRLYIGYYAPLLNRQECFAPLGATLLSAPPILFAEDQNANVLLDAYWTNVVYHGSLKGLGSSQLSYDMDVRDKLQRIIQEKYPQKDEELDASNLDIKRILQSRIKAEIEQLNSQKPAAEIQKVFSQLHNSYPNKGCLDAVLSTNMISVGLDVGRLALMVVNGQPLTTAEYIQASSRVGRSDVPGMVITNYYRDIARNTAHYEYFRSYHESFYRFVEPTSVTPWTYQARKRALHAAYLIAIRHSLPFLQASDFSIDNDAICKLTDIFKKRCRAAAGDLADATIEHIDSLVEQWQNQILYCEENRRKLVYNADKNDNSSERLIYDFDDKIKGLWPTLQSMRNVENTGIIKEIL